MNKKLIVSLIFYLILVPAIIFLGIYLFNDRKYNLISMMIAFLACVPFFISFERKKIDAKELVALTVMIVMSVVGRLIFVVIPFFKPVTAITIITAIAFGPQAGFITGSMSALISNLYFGQGPWTPFQMFAWGIIGFISGVIFYKKKKPNLILLLIVGILGGALFSFIMDIYTTFSMDEVFSFKRYFLYITTALPVTIVYIVSNVIFLYFLTYPILNQLERLKTKYGIFSPPIKEEDNH